MPSKPSSSADLVGPSSARPGDGSPPTRSLLASLLGWLTRGVLWVPKGVLIVAGLLAAGSVFLAATRLGFHASRLDLLNPRSTYNQRWLAYLDEFGQEDDGVIVVEGPDRSTVVETIDRLTDTLQQGSHPFDGVLSKIDIRPLRAKGLHYCSSQQLASINTALTRLAPVLRGDWAHLELTSVLEQWNREATAVCRLDDKQQVERHMRPLLQQLHKLLTGLADSLESRGSELPGTMGLLPGLGNDANHPLRHLAAQQDGHLIFDDGRLGVMLVRLARDADNRLARGTRAIARLRELLREEQLQHSNVRIGLTGLPVLENDEMRTSRNDMLLAGVVSLFGVACLFVAGFGGIRLPLLTVAALLVAMAWSFGYITLGIGHLNILSISFGAILIGLGIDFGIHYVTCYAQLRSTGLDCDVALVRTARTVGPGIMTGGVTTALAFFSAGLTDFTGVVELGIVAGGGILLCIVSALVVLPALIQRMQRRREAWRAPRPLPFARLCTPVLRAPFIWLTLAMMATAALAVGMSRLRFDHNLLHLQADGLESVRWEHRLLDSGDHSVWFAVSMSDTPAELLRKKHQLEQLKSVRRVEEIVSLLPAPDAEKQRAIAAIGQRVQALPAQTPLLPVAPAGVLLSKLHRARLALGNLSPWSAGVLPVLARCQRALETRPWPECSKRVSQFQQRLAATTLGQLRQLKSASDPDAPKASDLPPALLARFVGRHGRHLMRIYASGSIWDRQDLARFVHDLEKIDPHVTGHPVQTYYASAQMQTSYIHAAIYSLLAVAIVLMLDFRSVRMVLLAMMPMACGMTQMLGLLGWLGIPLNPANMIVLPLILGIGIDDGVHMVHDFLRGQRPYRVGRATAAAVVLTSATTMVGFGSMMLARHQGLRSLGQVLTLGVFCCLVTTMIALPAALAWLSQSIDSTPQAPSTHHTPTHSLRRPRRRNRESAARGS